LRLVRWIADYYCCAPEIAMKAVLPDAVRKEEEGWRERLYVRALPQHGEPPKLTKRQEDLWTIVEEWRELPLQELVRLAGTTSATIRKLEDKGLVSIAPQISERDPYAKEHILPTQPLELNAQQATALESIVDSMERLAKREDFHRQGHGPAKIQDGHHYRDGAAYVLLPQIVRLRPAGSRR